RRDLGTIQTYVTNGGRGAGSAVGPDELLRVPCDLDLAAAEDREEAEQLYAEQAAAMRDALVGAATGPTTGRRPPPPPAAARGAGRPGEADGGARGVRPPAAGRGPAADGDRLRAARRRAR